MGILRRLGNFLGFLKEDPHATDEDDDHRTADHLPRHPTSTRGFSVKVPVPAGGKPAVGPILSPCNLGEGGVQGFGWYGKRLRIDEDGDVADEFLDEVLPVDGGARSQEQRQLPRFEVKYTTKPAPVTEPAMAVNGNVHPSMKYQGTLRWV